MGRLYKRSASVVTTGGAGAATGEVQIPVPGGICRLVGLGLNYNAAAPGTTDTTVTALDPDGTSKTLYTKTDSAADVPFKQFKEQCVDSAGNAIAGAYEHVVVLGDLTFTLAQCNALDPALVATAVFEVL